MIYLETYDYTPQFLILRSIVNYIDPMNLNGCPDDEYDSEVKEIMELIPSAKSTFELAKLIQEVFIESFSIGTVGPFQKYLRMAQLLLSKETWI